MDVNELQRLIETIQRQMKTSRNESETRRKLIDPLLQAMGWNTNDTDQVKREYHLGDGRADYALFKGDSEKPSVVVEAKRLSISRRELDKAAEQGIGYCIKDGIPYFAVTDGQIWEVYETNRPVPLQEKLIVSFDLATPPVEAATGCAHARELWRQAAEEPIVEPPPLSEKVFIHGQRVDDDGYVLTKNGKRDKRFTIPYPTGTKWVVDGFPLNKDGWVLTPMGNRATRFKMPCPPNTKRIVDRDSGNRHFLDAEGYVLTKSGTRDKRYEKKPYPPGAVEFVDGLPVDEEGYVLTKSGKRDKRYLDPYYY